MPVIPTSYHRFRPDVFAGRTVVVMGNGTSLLGLDLARLHKADVLVSNGGFLTWPHAHTVMCSDRHYLATDPPFGQFLGKHIVVTQPQAVVTKDPRMIWSRRAFIEKVHGDIFADPTILVEGHNSASTNISLAVLQGAKRILLLGIDLAPGKGYRRRAYEDLIEASPQIAKSRYARMAVHLTQQSVHVLARRVQVINCSPRSALTCYPYSTLESEL